MFHGNKLKSLGALQVLLGSFGFGFLGIFGKLAFSHGISLGELLTFRFSLATILFGAGILIFSPQKIFFSKKQIGISLLLGTFGYAVFATLYFTAIQGLTVSLAALLLYTYPLFVSLIQHFIKKDALKSSEWIMLCTVFLGMGLLFWGDLKAHSIVAVFCGVGAAVTYAIYIVVSAKYQKNVSAVSSSFYVMLGGAMTLALIHQPSIHVLKSWSADQYWILLGIATICTVAPLTLILLGLQKLKESEAALISTFEPVTAAVMAYLIFNESMSQIQLIGAVLIVASLSQSYWMKIIKDIK